MISAGIVSIIDRLENTELAGSADHCSSALRLADKVFFDVLVTDTSVPAPGDGEWRPLVCLIRDRHPEKGVVLHSCNSNAAYLSTLLSRGVDVLVDSFDIIEHLGEAISAAERGDSYLSPRLRSTVEGHLRARGKPTPLSNIEIDVLHLLMAGLSVSEIAKKRFRAKQSISTCKCSAMAKLGVASDAQLFSLLSIEDVSLLAALKSTVPAGV
ncbi:LuxR C-terminal-related transcriptional regulator [Burkholderia sp. WSM2232]|uniref:LuxR C-terminal-related transcriptional regulator n=1 Tax=Burkholderia sp. WSM2232 TaxID=944436 RepID=UPI0018DCA5FD|nr:LuxR C-terminal-related transcriptional regulator [Burkholderia sp. WSM2232]